MIKEAIGALIDGNSLSFEESAGVMDEIMSGKATPAQIGAFLAALRINGETAEEIAGLASIMRSKVTPVYVTGPAIDIVGTGGDGSGSFNISTAAAFIAAGAGLKIAKHGNRAASSQCGSADVLEALGVKIELGSEEVATCIETAGIGFMFAPRYHPAMKHVSAPRCEIGIRTVFNILGPLTNPARTEYMVLGVPDEEIGNKIATVLYRLKINHALVVYSLDGMDEISNSGTSLIWDITNETISPPFEVTPESFGLPVSAVSDIKGGTPEENAQILRGILKGEKSACRDVAVMNAAAALVAADITDDLVRGARLAEESIDSGRAGEKLAALVELSQRLG